jgi:AcrR family transcriptional regulator
MSIEKRKYRLKARGDRHKATRLRIVEAAAALHDELGPARTTVSEIARRAGVERLTVYNHFPDETSLFEACGAHWMAEHPLPDLSAAFADTDPEEGLRQVLTALYGWYRENKVSNQHLQRDRLLMPALDAVMSIRMDRHMDMLADGLVARFTASDNQLEIRAAVALALDFWTWRRLAQEGMADAGAAAVMANAVRATRAHTSDRKTS